MQQKKLLLFGGAGLLGTRIRDLLAIQYKIIAPTREEVDVSLKKKVEEIIFNVNPDVIVYAAGETNVDKAELNKTYALLVNATAVGWVSKAAANLHVPVIYFSSDAVFKGDKQNKPYSETDKGDPINYYGLTKLKGEDEVLSASNKNVVLRLISAYTSFYPNKIDFARIILKKLSEKIVCYGIEDQYFNPVFSDDVAYGVANVIEKKTSGIIHFGATDYITNYEFAVKLSQTFGYKKNTVKPISVKNFFKDHPAKRPTFAWLDTAKAQSILDQNILHSNSYNINRFFLQVHNNLLNKTH